MEDKKNMSKEELKDYLGDQATKLGEVFSQCWESEDFKKEFIADPKKVFDKYGLDYNDDKEYHVLDTPPKTIIQVLPYENTKAAVKAMADRLSKTVEDIADDESKQILLEGWKWEVYQNTEDIYYIPIPLSPENLSPEELEMVNGGCIIFAILFLLEVQSIATTTTAATEAEFFVLLAVDVAVAVTVALAAAIGVLVVEALGVLSSVAYASQVSMNDFAKSGGH